MYNKIFSKILDSSIWLEPTSTRIVWLTFIAAMDEAGFVQFASAANVAHRAIVTLEEAEAAIACLEGTDEQSADPDNEGRRIERVPGGWIVLNAQKYRDLVTQSIARERTRERVRKHRERKNGGNAPVTPANVLVTQSEAEAEAEAEARSESRSIGDLDNQQQKNPPTNENAVSLVESAPPPKKEKPIFTGQRLIVHKFMERECWSILGEYAEAFNLGEWFWTLDDYAQRENLIIPRRDGGAWLQSQLVAEAQRRGIPIRFAVPDKPQSEPKWITETRERRRLGL